MTQDEIIRMALEAGVDEWEIGIEGNRSESQSRHLAKYERFAALVAAHEREACAKVCDDKIKRGQVTEYQHRYNYAYEDCAAAIRARGQ